MRFMHEHKIPTMRDDALEKIVAGLTSFGEVIGIY